MVVQREPLNIKKYIAVGLLTFLVFSLGVTIGLLLEKVRYSELKSENQLQDITYNSLQLQLLFLTSLTENEESCSVLITTLQQSVTVLEQSLEKLLMWEKDATISKEGMSLLKRKYTLDNIRYWLFANKNKETCDVNFITVLYFFSNKNCDICPDQGIILSYYKEIFDERLLIFPIDLDLTSEEPMIQLLISKFNITETTKPVLIVEDKKYVGILSTDELGNIICNSFSHPQSECEDVL